MAAETVNTNTFTPPDRSTFSPKEFKRGQPIAITVPTPTQSKLKPTQISSPVLQTAGVHKPKTR